MVPRQAANTKSPIWAEPIGCQTTAPAGIRKESRRAGLEQDHQPDAVARRLPAQEHVAQRVAERGADDGREAPQHAHVVVAANLGAHDDDHPANPATMPMRMRGCSARAG